MYQKREDTFYINYDFLYKNCVQNIVYTKNNIKNEKLKISKTKCQNKKQDTETFKISKKNLR